MKTDELSLRGMNSALLSLTVDQMRTLLLIADGKSITRVAEMLSRQYSSVANQINVINQVMVDYLGRPALTMPKRKSKTKNLELTEVGKELVRYCDEFVGGVIGLSLTLGKVDLKVAVASTATELFAELYQEDNFPFLERKNGETVQSVGHEDALRAIRFFQAHFAFGTFVSEGSLPSLSDIDTCLVDTARPVLLTNVPTQISNLRSFLRENPFVFVRDGLTEELLNHILTDTWRSKMKNVREVDDLDSGLRFLREGLVTGGLLTTTTLARLSANRATGLQAVYDMPEFESVRAITGLFARSDILSSFFKKPDSLGAKFWTDFERFMEARRSN